MSLEDVKGQLIQAIAALESQRGLLGDAVVDAALGPMREKLMALEAAANVEEQRKLVTILFADLVGFTKLSERLDPEEVRQIQQAYFAVVTRPIQEHGGWVEKYIGDAVLAVFGLPQAQENDPDRALRAALGMQAAMLELNQRLEQDIGTRLGTTLQIRIGVHTGLVLVSLRSQADFVVTGDAVNLTSRLQSAAPPGGVLLSHDTYRHARGAFDLQPLEPLTIKGKSEPVQVYRLLAAKPRSFRTRNRGVEGIETRMVGRDAEFQALQHAYLMAIEDSERQMATVVGDPGLGKSRLLYEFENWVDLRPERAASFRGRARQETQRLPYSLLRDLFAFHFGIQDDDALPAVWEKVEKGISGAESHASVSDDNARAHIIGQLIGYDFSDSPHIQAVRGDPQQIRDRGLNYINDFFKEIASHGPLLIFFEDLHWADDSSLDAVARLALALHGRPVLIVGAARPGLYERREYWMEGQDFHRRLDLHPLSKRDSRRLVEDVLQKVEDLPENLHELLISNAEGNPFYLEELVKMLVEDGVIVTGEESWKVRPERLGQARIPTTLTGVLQVRLEGLPEVERTVLQQASVIGRVFWDKGVDYLNQSGDTGLDTNAIERGLVTLREKEMVYRRDFSIFAGAGEHIFKHAILREVTYESVLRRLRRLYHSLAAEWLMAQGGQRASELTGLIADHLEYAGRTGDALEYLRKAGGDAETSFALREAIDYYSRALVLTGKTELEMRCNLLLKREALYYMVGERELQADDLNALVELIENSAPSQGITSINSLKPELAYRQALYDVTTGNDLQAEIESEYAVTIAKAFGASKVAIKSYVIWASALKNQAKYDVALAKAEEGLQLALQMGDEQGQSKILNICGVVAMEQADLEAAQRYLHKSLELATKTDDRRYMANTRGNLAMLAGMLGDFSAAQSEYQIVLKIDQEIGDRRAEANCWGNLGWLFGLLGDYPSAYAHALQQRQISIETGDRLLETVALTNLSSFAWLQGDHISAFAHAEESLTQAREIKVPNWEAWALTVLGHAFFSEGRYPDARQAYSSALEIRRNLNQGSLAPEPLAGLARTALAEGDLSGAQAYTDHILAYFDNGGTLDGTDEPLRIYLTCVQVLEALNDPRAGKILDLAYRQLQAQASRILDESSRRSYLENVPWHREIVRLWQKRA